MVTATTVRTKLDTKLFTPYGQSATWKSATPTYNDRGEVSSTSYSNTTITVVPYNVTNPQETYESFGSLQEGEMDCAIKYSDNVAINDVLTIDGEDWIVKAIERNYLGENVVTIVRLAKEQN